MIALLIACYGPETDTTDTAGEPPVVFTVAALNVESGGADVDDVADDTVLPITGEDLFAFVEVENSAAAGTLVAAAGADGGTWDYRVGTTGYEDRLVLAWNDERFAMVSYDELDDINVGGTVRAPLVGHMLERESGTEFLLVVNHLWRTDSDKRHQQAQLLNTWGAAQTLPIVTIGDFNFDWNTDGSYHDDGYDLLTANDVFAWVRPPDPLVKTQCSGSFDSVLDFAFVAGDAKDWQPVGAILRQEDDYCRGARQDNFSDHRPITATFTL